MEIAVTGASGLIGSHLCRALKRAGHRPVAMVRRPAAGNDEIYWKPSLGEIDAASLEGFDGVVHLAGAGIGDKRWSDARRQVLYESRIGSTRLLVDAFGELQNPPKVFVSGSAVGYYGDRGDEVLTEVSSPGEGFLPELCIDWENAATAANGIGVRTCTIRTGIVLTKSGGALAKMLPLFRVGLGGKFGRGQQWFPWITLTDEVRAIEHLLTTEVSGPINLTAPNPVTNETFARTLASTLGRPAFVPVPEFGPKLLLGNELAQALLFDSARVEPIALETHGFTFSYSELEPALESIVSNEHEVAE